MTPVRAPDLVRGTDLRELPRCMPVADLRPATRFNGEPVTRRGVYVGNNTVKADEGLVVWTHYAHVRDEWPTYIGHLAIDWSDRAALYLSLAWLADRGHACLWMLPTTHGGRVEAWDGLTAWEVSAILVARSVGRVARGLGPVRDMLGPSVAWTASKTMRSGRRVDLGHGGYKRTSVATMTATHTSDLRWFYGGGNAVTQSGERDWSAHPSADLAAWEAHACGMADRAALADGCALHVPGGLLLPDLGAEHE